MADYLNLRMTRFSDSLDAAQSYFAIQGIQDLCLEIRRFRELSELVSDAAPPFAQDPDASIFDNLLLKANALREIDIAQAITMKWLPTLDLSEYFNCLKDEELRLRGSFLEAASDFPASALTRTRLLVFSVMAIRKRKLNFQKKVRRRIARSAAGLIDLAGGRAGNGEALGHVCESAEAFLFKLEAGEVCLDKKILTEDISGPIEAVCTSLIEWKDLSLTLQSLDALHRGETGITLSDPAAYVNFRHVLQQQTRDLTEAYRRIRKPLLKVLGRLEENL
jgi:hypothetical protein